MTINAAGLENGLRNKRDGYTFFGEKEKNVRNFNHSKDDTVVNDFLINYKIEGISNHSLFYIVFRRSRYNLNKVSQKYYIKNSEETSKDDKSLIYVKLDNKFVSYKF